MFDYKDEGGKIVITIDCNLDEETAAKFREYVNTLIGQGYKYFVLDMEKVFYSASCGLGVLCELRERLEDEEGWIRLARTSEDLQEVFRFVMLDELFPNYESVGTALVD